MSEDLEKNKKRKKKKEKKKWTFGRVFKYFVAFCLICAYLIGAGVAYYAYKLGTEMINAAPELKIESLVSNNSSRVYDSQGRVIADLGEYLRENIAYEDMPESLVDAFVSIEDSRYFEHNGFDLPRFTKAFLEIGKEFLNTKKLVFSQGGSTFTMQLIKNSYFTVDSGETSTIASKSIDRKVQEIYLALQLEKSATKEEIFELYVNKLNFGGNVRGVQKAAEYYFGKDAKELSLSESALLAGIVNLPNSYNPYAHLDWATTRRNEVLDLMVLHGYITKEEAALAKSIKIEDLLVGESFIEKEVGGDYQTYLDVVINEVIEKTGYDPYYAPLEIYTCLDVDVQNEIYAIEDGEEEAVQFPDDLMQIAIVSMNNQTGEIVGVGGGRYYQETGARSFNRATQMYKQPGSSVKPFLSYALAFENLGWATDHVICDRPYVYRGTNWRINNFDGKYRGDVTLQEAVASSLNTPAIQTLQEVLDVMGREYVIDYLRSLGFTQVNENNFDTGFAIGGSTFEVTPVQLAAAHAVLINGGRHIEPHTVKRVDFIDGTSYIADTVGEQVLSEEAAYMTATLEQYTVEGPFYNYMQILKRPYTIYAKTGTTDWGSSGLQYGIPRGAAKEKWMVSSSTIYTNVVWLGYDMAVEGENTYFNSYKSSLNLPGNVSKVMQDKLHEKLVAGEDFDKSLTQPEGVVTIEHILGAYPYATGYVEGAQMSKGLIKKDDYELIDVYEIPNESEEGNNSISVKGYWNEWGGLDLIWVTKDCVNGEKDISLHENGVDYDATGRCYFGLNMLYGSGGGAAKCANIIVNGEYYTTVWADDYGYAGIWDLDRNSNIQACAFYDGMDSVQSCTQIPR